MTSNKNGITSDKLLEGPLKEFLATFLQNLLDEIDRIAFQEFNEWLVSARERASKIGSQEIQYEL